MMFATATERSSWRSYTLVAPNSIERAFGVWKRTFHVLHGEIGMKPANVSRIIIACAVLHNLRLMWGNQQWIRNLLKRLPWEMCFRLYRMGEELEIPLSLITLLWKLTD
ncbi:hypothetical protein DPMN_034862 [Dreissena polymorpha]|uniref:DDE Tnp4 domain-containing protein n=1 Tax=Dreissena polymorpha TaxID=45954 RepID=A0A9D4M881_DREPO|nr:hypothetical protein DPMN_034862 [Dreissena polymorpha]